ncbi:S41 family peptidase [Pseudofulvimonas gallinarii]|uniref:S41 family peptidase n=1 Tax=Pseudofulvimonas gallinarii TaxID=634155 RepID=UPI0035E930F3
MHHNGPKAMLINGISSSGGDALPYYFRKLGLGKLIGTRTWGGLIGISGNPAMVDNGVLLAATFSFMDTDNQWAVENEGVTPDIEVIDRPELIAAGVIPASSARSRSCWPSWSAIRASRWSRRRRRRCSRTRPADSGRHAAAGRRCGAGRRKARSRRQRDAAAACRITWTTEEPAHCAGFFVCRATQGCCDATGVVRSCTGDLSQHHARRASGRRTGDSCPVASRCGNGRRLRARAGVVERCPAMYG